MNRLLAILASVMLTMTAWARNDWYDTPIALAPGILTLDTIPAISDDAMVHLRLSGEKKQSAKWTLIWRDSKTDDRIEATVTMPDLRSRDGLYPTAVNVDVTQTTDGETIAITSTSFAIQDEFFSLKFVYDGFSALLFGGDKEKKLLAELPIDLSRPTIVQLASDDDLQARRISVMYNIGNTPTRADLPGAEMLEHVMHTDRGIEGTWVYLDRDIDTKRASLDDKYRLIVIKADDSTYQIVSIDPDAASMGLLRPLQVKGWLRATRFQNNYDMVWYDANGRELDDDNNAQLSDDGNILTLRFPVYKSQIRFARQ